MVALTASPASGSEFTGWSGSADCSDGQVRLTVGVLSEPTLTGNFFERRARLDFDGFSEMITPPSSIGIQFCGQATCTLKGFFLELAAHSGHHTGYDHYLRSAKHTLHGLAYGRFFPGYTART